MPIASRHYAAERDAYETKRAAPGCAPGRTQPEADYPFRALRCSGGGEEDTAERGKLATRQALKALQGDCERRRCFKAVDENVVAAVVSD